jgi:cysteate synthase
MKPTKKTSMHYKLACPVCDSLFEDDGVLLSCPEPHAPGLLTTRYDARKLEPDAKAGGIYRYGCWLPGRTRIARASRSVTYQSEKLNSALGLSNLWIAFSGYWPERGAMLETATFKELEVVGVLSRMPEQSYRALVVASAGNTAAAFAQACSENNIPCLIVVPESGMKKMLFAYPLESCVKIICIMGASYSDAILFADRRRRSQERGPAGRHGYRDAERDGNYRAASRLLFSSCRQRRGSDRSP